MKNKDIERAHIAHVKDFEEYIMAARAKFGSLPNTVLVHLDNSVKAATDHRQSIEALK